MDASKFTITAAQSSPIKGDIVANIQRHAEFAETAAKHDANVIVFPELSLTGYEPTLAAELATDANDSRLSPLQELSDRMSLSMICGCPIRSAEAKPYIGAFIIRPNQAIAVYRKRFLDKDEVPYFIPSNDVVVCRCHNQDIGCAICFDICNPEHAADAKRQGATIYAAGVAITPKGMKRAEENMAAYAKEHGFLSVMANYASETGGYSISGRSAIWDKNGEVIAQSTEAVESLAIASSSSDEGWSGLVVSV